MVISETSSTPLWFVQRGTHRFFDASPPASTRSTSGAGRSGSGTSQVPEVLHSVHEPLQLMTLRV